MFLYQYTPTSDLYLVSDVMQVDNTKLISADFNKCVQVGAKMHLANFSCNFLGTACTSDLDMILCYNESP